MAAVLESQGIVSAETLALEVEADSGPPACASPVDMGAHTGLRGALAAWVALYHCVLFSDLQVDLQGASLMPLFFMLSGFSLAVVYGAKPPPLGTFMRRRLARVYPSYLLGCAMAFPLVGVGFGQSDPDDAAATWSSTAVSVAPVSTLVGFLAGFPLDGPGWTVATLLVMWLAVPTWLRRARAMSDKELVQGIVLHFWLQLVLALGVYRAVYAIDEGLGYWPPFAFATMHPLSRFPVLLMGLYAGTLRARGAAAWCSSVGRFFPLLGAEDDAQELPGGVARRQRRVLLVLFLIVAALDTVARQLGDFAINGALWFQALVAFAQLELIVGLSFPLCAQWLRGPRLQWLGQRSMALYLVHWPLLHWTMYLVRGSSLPWRRCSSADGDAEEDDDVCDAWEEERLIPVWAVPVVLAASLAVAEALYRWVEVPCRSLLSARR